MAAVLALFGPVCRSFAQSPEPFEEHHRKDLAANPPGVVLDISVAGAGRAFRPGERIPLTLAYSSTIPKKYGLARSFRGDLNQAWEAVVERPARSLRTGLFAFDFWLVSPAFTPTLSEKPLTARGALNGVVQFDAPGTYRLYLRTGSVLSDSWAQTTSNIFEVEILPEDPEWSSAKLQEIEAALSGPENDGTPRAEQDLRFLATPAAVELAFRHALRSRKPIGGVRWLLGVRDRAHAIAAFDRYLSEPDAAIDHSLILVRAAFDVLTEVEAHERDLALPKYEKAVAIGLIPAIAAKSGAARGQSVEAVMAIAPEEARAAGLHLPYNGPASEAAEPE